MNPPPEEEFTSGCYIYSNKITNNIKMDAAAIPNDVKLTIFQANRESLSSMTLSLKYCQYSNEFTNTIKIDINLLLLFLI